MNTTKLAIRDAIVIKNVPTTIGLYATVIVVSAFAGHFLNKLMQKLF